MFIQRLTLKKLLSFNEATVELGQLNVLIGPNAVGKSNLIEVIGLLQAAPTSLAAAILRGGGVRQWLWLGDAVPSPIASIECDLNLTRGRHVGRFQYELQFSEDASGLVIVNERLPEYFLRSSGQARFVAGGPADISEMGIQPTESVLSQFKSPVDSTPITEVGRHFAQMRVFREFRTCPGETVQLSCDSVGSGSTACRDFGTAIRENPRVWSILLIDSEGPLRANASASLCREQGWSESNAGSIFWMVEMMEAWFHADKDAFADFYRSGFQRNSLKSNPNVGQISKKDLQHGLSAATKNSQKGDYYDNKTTHGTKLLASIDADLVRKSAPNCHDLFQTVLAKLAQ